MIYYHNKNFGKHPLDPEYDDDFNAEEEYDRYCEALEDKADYERELEREYERSI